MSTVTLDQALQTAIAYHQAGQLTEAEALYRQILAVQPQNPHALHLLGVIANQTGHPNAAVDLILQAIVHNDDNPACHSGLGEAYRALGRLDEAISSYQKAVALKPDSSEPYTYMGIAYHSKGQFDEALTYFQQALALQPDSGGAHKNLGRVLKDQGRIAEAVAYYRQAVALEPKEPALHSSLLFVLHLHPDYDSEALMAEHRLWDLRHGMARRQFQRPHPNIPDPDRRLKVGYVSPDLREHPVGHCLLPLLENHDHARFEITCYADAAKQDAVTDRLRAYADHWRATVGWTEERLTEQIREDGMDILVDLALHTGGNRLPVFARKPAPVQVTWLGLPGTTGLETMDYRLTDPYLDPPGTDSGYSEVSIRLPDSFWCYQRSDASPEVGSLPALGSGVITFGCLNSFGKVNETCLKTWAEILHAVPQSRLILKADEGSHREKARASLALDVASDRLHFMHRASLTEYFENHGRIDIALDTFPYNGHTTSLDALWMGVPVVSLVGRTAVGRGGLSILSNIGLPELAAQTEDEYVRIAVDLANDLPRLAQLRATMRERMLDSPLMDAPRFARAVEEAYRTMWQAWCRGRTESQPQP